jgi:hypothetical protein
VYVNIYKAWEKERAIKVQRFCGTWFFPGSLLMDACDAVSFNEQACALSHFARKNQARISQQQFSTDCTAIFHVNIKS